MGSTAWVESHQRDEYYDTATEELKLADLTVRLRFVGAGVWVSLKGPRVFQGRIHQRVELEFEAASSTQVRAQIEATGMRPTSVIEKRRRESRIGLLTVAIDHMPFLGYFVEIEGPTRESVEKAITALSLSASEATRQNYTELLEAFSLKEGLSIRPNLRATFEAERRWRAGSQYPST